MNIIKYIDKTWDDLTRDVAHIREQVSEEKYNDQDILFIPAHENLAKIHNFFKARIKIKKLSKDIKSNYKMKEQGLLYLPHPYVVPGGRFNEMYGWDSYFIILGLLHSNRIELAKNMVDNQIYQIKYYGKVLNANRTYYLSRSHPPLVANAAIKVFEKTKDIKWLENIAPFLEDYFLYFRKGKKYNKKTKLSCYCDECSFPAYELKDKAEAKYYENIAKEFEEKEIKSNHPLDLFYDKDKKKLKGKFYRADRSMRESGFDVTNLFGDFAVDINFMAPVCLNSLLYKMAEDLAYIYQTIQNKRKVTLWKKRADELKEAINKYLWDEEKGGYYSYDFELEKRDDYLFATIFYPLWAGVASDDQAKKVLQTAKKLIVKNGLMCSTFSTGNQWDAPFGWAPLHYFAVYGMKSYGFETEAKDLANKLLKLIEEDFEKNGTIKEKYDVVNGSSVANIKFGYSSNEIGFGWTNGVYLDLLNL